MSSEKDSGIAGGELDMNEFIFFIALLFILVGLVWWLMKVATVLWLLCIIIGLLFSLLAWVMRKAR